MKIVGGIAANQGSWPSIAFITWKYKGYYTLPTGVTVLVSSAIQCDGTLISTTRVLTAGKNGIFLLCLLRIIFLFLLRKI